MTKVSGAKLPASTTTDDWSLIVAYEAEKERKEGADFSSFERTEKEKKTKTFRLLRSF